MAATTATLEVQFATVDPERDDVYLPTQEEIREVCQEIQAEWTESERARRSRGQAGKIRTKVVAARRFTRLLIDRRRFPMDEWAA